MQATLNLNGVLQDVQVFSPSLNDSPLAVVHMSVLKQLTDLLPTASLSTIKFRITELINNAHNLEQIVEIMKQEIAFQETVNIIRCVNAEQVKYAEMDKVLDF